MTASSPTKNENLRHANSAQGGTSTTDKTMSVTAPTIIALFVLSLIPPIYFYLGGTKLNIMRILLLITFFPLLFKLFTGFAGKLRAIDFLMMMFCLWMGFLTLVHLGFSRLPLAIMSVIELLGGYLIGRVLIRNETDYKFFFRVILLTQLFLLPFATLEFFTNINLLKNLLDPLFHTFDKSPTQTWRNGYARVMTGFEHPILFGLFCAITAAPLFYIYRRRPLFALLVVAIPSLLTYMSLSSAPAIAVAISVMLIVWDQLTGGKWKPLLILSISVWIFLSLASNRGPVVILIDKFTFDAHTAWTRLWIWHYGFENVKSHPFIGIGPEADWERPSWLTGSVDNFWLVIALRYGFVGLFLLMATFASGMWSIIRAKNLTDEHASWRTGFVIALVGLYFTLTTVHIWGNASSFLMCYIGAGLWFTNTGQGQTSTSDELTQQRREKQPRTDDAPKFWASDERSDGRGRLPTTRFAHNIKRSQH